ncbi:MAG: PEP-CTERM sorting domain-containing protein [Pirellulales bacterium]
MFRPSALILFPVVVLSASYCHAALLLTNLYTGNVGLSVDGVGSNSSPVGALQAEIPVGATIQQAYLYAAGTPSPWYASSPTTLAEYNGAGITLGGNAITNFSKLVGAISDRPEIGRWYTGRADVTTVVQGLVAADPLNPSPSWTYTEGPGLNSFIDGGVLVVVYEHASLPDGSVVLYDGGQSTGGETTNVNFAGPLDTTVPGFFANMSLAISFSTTDAQTSTIDINGTRLTSAAGGFDDGISSDGGLLTAGGIGDSIANPADPMSVVSADDELYDLTPFLSDNDAFFAITTENTSDDDNIFFLGLHVAARIVPEPSSFVLAGVGLFTLAGSAVARRRRRSLARGNR